MLKFSIVIPAYNVAPFLRECLDSVLAQNYGGWECICVNDGSSDESGAILEEYASRDARFIVIHQENAGVSAARNAGLDRAKGEWICFLDGDDIWSPKLLDLCVAEIRKYHNADIIAFDICRFVAKNDLPWTWGQELAAESSVHDSSKQFNSKYGTSSFWGKIYRHSRIRDIAFKPYTVGEDQLFMMEAFLRCDTIVSIDVPLYGYRTRPGSAMNSAVTLRKTLDSMRYNYDELRLLQSSTKRIPSCVVRISVNWLVEQCFLQMNNLPKKDYGIAFDEWRRLLAVVRKFKKISVFQKMRITVFCNFPFERIAMILFGCPALLKQKGFHR